MIRAAPMSVVFFHVLHQCLLNIFVIYRIYSLLLYYWHECVMSGAGNMK